MKNQFRVYGVREINTIIICLQEANNNGTKAEKDFWAFQAECFQEKKTSFTHRELLDFKKGRK